MERAVAESRGRECELEGREEKWCRCSERRPPPRRPRERSEPPLPDEDESLAAGEDAIETRRARDEVSAEGTDVSD